MHRLERVSILAQKADPAAQSLRFIEYFWRQASHKRSGGSDETKRKNYEERFLERRSVEECENLNNGRMRRLLRAFSKVSNSEQSERLGNSIVRAALRGGGHG